VSLKITIDAAPVLMRSAGVKNYIYHWLTSLRRRASAGEEIQAFPLLADLGTLHHDASDFPMWSTVLRLGAMHSASRLGPGAVGLLAGRTDVFHASNQVHCGPRAARLTATIHDVTSRLMPELHTRGNIEADRRFAERILTRADALIAVSENTRQDAIRWWGLPADRIRTIYSGVPEEYFIAQPAKRQRPHVLCVGTIEPRKNLSTLLDAWSLLRSELRHDFELVFAGPAAWGEKNTFNRIRAEATYLGYVPEVDLPRLIAGAAAFAYPSLYEGFGFPVVQAMAAGTPVITSNTSCLPEITGGAALLVDPRSPAEIAAALTKLLESETLRRELAARGRERATVFRWDRCAEESLEFFRTVAGK
jgi:glycosyltransferase involved in cell wall biosynthesis